MKALVETTKMSTKGQVIIPKDVRAFTDADEDTIFTVIPLDKQTIVLKKLDKKKLIEEFRALRKSVRRKLSEDEVNELVHKPR